jgi:tRNA threonylcarbamoyladenosine biosynthesis protein TsaE
MLNIPCLRPHSTGHAMPRELVLETTSAEQSARVGAAIGSAAGAGDVITLVGPLGAGKTTVVQGMAAGLGVAERATSPSFTLIHEHRGRLPFYHVDLYRLAPDETEGLGLEEVLGGGGVAAVEWGERLPLGACPDALEITISFGEQDTARRLALTATGPMSEALLRRVEAARREAE